VLREVCVVLRDYFEQFALIDIEVLEANIEELLELDAIERLKMMETWRATMTKHDAFGVVIGVVIGVVGAVEHPYSPVFKGKVGVG
jgi:hypothetical protein